MERWLLAAPVYALAYTVAALVFWWMARRRGMAHEATLRVMFAGLIGGLATANILQLFATGAPGKTIEGGILGGWIAVELAKRTLGVKRSTGDLFALAIPAGEAIGRIACFIGGCCYGKVATGIAWAVYTTLPRVSVLSRLTGSFLMNGFRYKVSLTNRSLRCRSWNSGEKRSLTYMEMPLPPISRMGKGSRLGSIL